jgi:hypothetical protein
LGALSAKLGDMSVQEIKATLAKLPLKEQDEVMAFLFHLRHAQDRTYHEQISRRMQDKDPAHWLTAEQFERELGENQ